MHRNQKKRNDCTANIQITCKSISREKFLSFLRVWFKGYNLVCTTQEWLDWCGIRCSDWLQTLLKEKIQSFGRLTCFSKIRPAYKIWVFSSFTRKYLRSSRWKFLVKLELTHAFKHSNFICRLYFWYRLRISNQIAEIWNFYSFTG